MYNFIFALGAQEGIQLSPAQIKKITKHIFNSGQELSEGLVKKEIKLITA